MTNPLDRLPTLAEMREHPCAPSKGLPHQLEKERADKAKADRGKAFRDAVWTRDKGRCRATGTPLQRVGLSWDRVGEVDHAYPRSLAPERIYEVGNGLLLTKRLNRLRKVACPRAPECRLFDYTGPEDRGQIQHFIWRDEDGRITKETDG